VEAGTRAERKSSSPRPDFEALRTLLDEAGYVIFDPGVPEATIDAAIAETEPHFRVEGSLERTVRRMRRALRGRSRTMSHRDPARVQDAWTISKSVRAISTAPRVLELLRELYGRGPRPFQTLNFRVGSEQATHADTWHFNSEPAGFMCGIWVALEDIHEDSGPLVYYPGSHKLPELTKADIADAGAPEWAAYSERVQALIEREGLEPRYGNLSKGQALLWSSNLLHGGAPQADPARTRWSQVTHYFFEDCRYWKPILSGPGDRHYWQPTWIG
jgi:ectoine hydroxylase-related dioxygenase (phytanoyl-CoA dioxygenase family)